MVLVRRFLSSRNRTIRPTCESTKASSPWYGWLANREREKRHGDSTLPLAPPSWRLAPHNMSFVGKDTLPLCRQIRTTNGLDTGDPAALEAFVRHIENDPLIALGFAGQGAIGKDSAFAPITPDPPGITLGQMVAYAQDWTQKGHAR